nr:hypothetical protein [uncultured Oscillibacter sp.]
MKLNHKLILTGPALLLTVIAYACMRPADSISGTAFPLQRVIFPSLILVLPGVFVPGKQRKTNKMCGVLCNFVI